MRSWQNHLELKFRAAAGYNGVRMNKKKKMIKRAPQHQIDTKAVRQILSILDENWLIRNQDERDYGIDLTIERFNGENATGDFILVQVKGTESQFEENIKLPKFPTKTIAVFL